MSIENIEIYNFTNHYASTEIELNIVPLTFAVNEFDLALRNKSIDLVGIDNLLKQGVILEAVEVDDDDDLYFYGKKSVTQTLAGASLSLADLAVIYRSVFHYGYNSPYISLDKHEDNRFAKVNFGGHLENTRTGHVVLEADKLFKALSTGLDPNTHGLITKDIRNYVPEFLTEDERSLLESSTMGQTQIRYWFYPDSIGTVTDGTIGAVLNHQFWADVERMDSEINAGRAVRDTIAHLNHNFGQYENAFKTFRELSTVGRIMSLVNWLKGMGMDAKVELDELLSVMLPAFTTPTKTKKMLAITTAVYPKIEGLTDRDVREYSRVYYISDLLDKYDARTTDKKLLEAASGYFDEMDINDLAPPKYRTLTTQIEHYDQLTASKERELRNLKEKIERSKVAVDEYSSDYLINKHNDLVDKYNSLLQVQELYVNEYNSLINDRKQMILVSRAITSVGGGISLGPKQFKRILRTKNAPKIREISSLKRQIRTVGKVAKSGNWIRNNVRGGGARVNALSVNRWSLSKSSNGSTKHLYTTGKSDRLSVSVSPAGEGWVSETNVNGSIDVVRFSGGSSALQVSHPQLGMTGRASISPDGKRIVFNR